MKLIRILSLLAFALLVVAPHQHAFGQSQSGAIAGTVADPTGAALTGAQISIESQDIHVVSNDQGRFFISGIAPGQYRLTISYLGFATQQKQVTVSPGQTATLAAYMELVSQKQTVVVTAPRVSGEAEALNEERTADNILQVLPSEVIRSLPNANMADALGRMPSVTLEMKARANTCRSAPPNLGSPTQRWTASICPRRSRAYGRSSLTPSPPTSWSPSRSAKPSRPTWMATASAAR